MAHRDRPERLLLASFNRGLTTPVTHDRWSMDTLDTRPVFPRERTGAENRGSAWD